MMDGGKKIFSQEGIAEALPILQRIQNTVAFSHDDVQSVYEFEDDCTEAVPLLKLLPDLKDCDILADKAYGTKEDSNLSARPVRPLYDPAESKHKAAVAV